MFERFTDRARKVIALANKEADRFHHAYIGTEHLLLAQLQDGSGVAMIALGNLGVDTALVQREVESHVVTSGTPAPNRPKPFTPQGKRVLELTVQEAQALGQPYIGTEHILLGLLAERDGVAARALASCGLTLERLRDEIRVLAPPAGITVTKPPPPGGTTGSGT